MTQKDYAKFAKLLLCGCSDDFGGDLDAVEYRDILIVKIADIFAADGSQFNREQFYLDCEPKVRK